MRPDERRTSSKNPSSTEAPHQCWMRQGRRRHSYRLSLLLSRNIDIVPRNASPSKNSRRSCLYTTAQPRRLRKGNWHCDGELSDDKRASGLCESGAPNRPVDSFPSLGAAPEQQDNSISSASANHVAHKIKREHAPVQACMSSTIEKPKYRRNK